MKRLAIGAAVLVAACSRQGTTQSGNSAAMTPVPAASPVAPEPMPTANPAASPSPSSSAPGEAMLPPADGVQASYIGRWAATKQLCASGAWRFYATHLETAGGVSCSYNKIDKVPGGYDLHATCTAEAPPEPDVIKLRFAESAQAMLVDSTTLKSVGLIYCEALK